MPAPGVQASNTIEPKPSNEKIGYIYSKRADISSLASFRRHILGVFATVRFGSENAPESRELRVSYWPTNITRIQVRPLTVVWDHDLTSTTVSATSSSAAITSPPGSRTWKPEKQTANSDRPSEDPLNMT